MLNEQLYGDSEFAKKWQKGSLPRQLVRQHLSLPVCTKPPRPQGSCLAGDSDSWSSSHTCTHSQVRLIQRSRNLRRSAAVCRTFQGAGSGPAGSTRNVWKEEGCGPEASGKARSPERRCLFGKTHDALANQSRQWRATKSHFRARGRQN